jgi:hypothetical protein
MNRKSYFLETQSRRPFWRYSSIALEPAISAQTTLLKLYALLSLGQLKHSRKQRNFLYLEVFHQQLR